MERSSIHNITTPLVPPNAPFFSRPVSITSSTKNDLTADPDAKELPASLSTHYLPAKFPNTVLSGGPKRRKVWTSTDAALPKRGGGRLAFGPDAARMPGEGDDDYDGVTLGPREGGRTQPRARWNRFKWTLFVSNLVFTAYSIAGLVACLLLWFNIWQRADIIRVGNQPELIISTLAASLGVFTALVGWAGILLNNRAFLAVYSLLTWACFALLVTSGYITYKRRTFNLEGKLSQQWSQQLGLAGRARIQDQLHCCGYFSPFVEATASQTCYARSVLPGCQALYLRFERQILEWWYTAIFAVVPAQLLVMVAGLLCANHVTFRFGKGMMPRAYRLDSKSLAIIMDNYASQLAEQYGVQVATEVIERSRSIVQLDSLPTVSYIKSSTPSLSGSRFDTLAYRTSTDIAN